MLGIFGKEKEEAPQGAIKTAPVNGGIPRPPQRPAAQGQAQAAGAGGGDAAANVIRYADQPFEREEITSAEDMTRVTFSRVINSDVRLGSHLYSRIAVLKVADGSKDAILVVDRASTSPDEVREVIDLLTQHGLQFKRGFFAHQHIIIALSKGHLTAESLRSSKEIRRDPQKSGYFNAFSEIVAWAYDNKADDIDWVVDESGSYSQVCFKIGGRYIRPRQYRISTQNMIHMLGIAWQLSTGGAQAQFDTLTEQQAQVELNLPSNKTTRPNGARIRLRWSGMANDKGTVVTMRIQRLGENTLVKSLEEAGYLSTHMDIFRRVINSEGGIVCFSGVVGSGKSTSLARLLTMLPSHLKIQSIEDPVELEIPNAYQKTITRDLTNTGVDKAFLSAARAIFRSALDVLYLGEVRDVETGNIARQVVESGHSVYTTTHARSALGIVDRFVSPQIGIPRTVLGAPDIIKLLIYQALLPVNCPHCSKSPDDFAREKGLTGIDLDRHQRYFDRIERLYNVERSRFRLRDENGCPHCITEGLPELNGLNGRTVVCEMVEPDENMIELILEGKSLALQQYWKSTADGRYDTPDMTGKTAMECAVYKATLGHIDPREIEMRFMSYETVENKLKAAAHGKA